MKAKKLIYIQIDITYLAVMNFLSGFDFSDSDFGSIIFFQNSSMKPSKFYPDSWTFEGQFRMSNRISVDNRCFCVWTFGHVGKKISSSIEMNKITWCDAKILWKWRKLIKYEKRINMQTANKLMMNFWIMMYIS